MRPNQQNKRSRGRNNNNGRKHANPLSRNFESNGPDVKIRGNAAHVAEKYVQLARDAQASGDSVMAENYLQHAEHYFRIISAAQASQPYRQDQSQNEDDDLDTDPAISTDEGSRDSEESTSEPAAVEAQPAQAGKDAEDEKAEDKPRKRRPRRKRTSEAEAGASAASDPGSAPQPDVGELPAFITSASAAE